MTVAIASPMPLTAESVIVKDNVVKGIAVKDIVSEISKPPIRRDILWPQQGLWTYADYLRLPDDGKRYEIIEGVLYVANAPNFEHQIAVSKVSYHLMLYVTPRQLGLILTAPFEVHLSENSKPVQPDILFIPSDQLPKQATQIFEGAPALIIEIISPSSVRRDRNIKFTAYEKAGVQEYWLVDLKTRSVEVYTWSHGEYALFGQYTGDELVQSRLLTEFSVKTSALFQPL